MVLFATELPTADVPAEARARSTWARREKSQAGFHLSGCPFRVARGSACPSSNQKKPPPPIFSRKRENRPFRYPHTAANEPRRWVARLNKNAAAFAARGAMMLILKYFLVVGTVLTLGLIALNAHLLPDGSKPPAAVIHSATTASLPTVAPNVPPPETSVAAEPVQPPAKSASPTRRSHHSARVQRRSH